MRCADDSTYSQLDFWVGEREVVSDGQVVGTNSIATVQDGCAITEHWTDVTGGTGQSLFYVHPRDRRWRPVWVTPYARAPGGLKEKAQQDPMPDGAIRFQGILHDGSSVAGGDARTAVPPYRPNPP